MAITVRKGYENQFDINKMLPGEFAVTTDTYKVYVCMAAGVSKELASVEELQNILGASEEAFRAFQELLNAMESDSVITGLLSDINSIKSGEYTISFSEAEERSNIENTDTIKVILGKIRKFFSSFSAVAFSGKYADLGDKPILGDAASKSVANNMTTSTAGTHVADAYQVKLLKGQLDEQNTNIENLFTHQTFSGKASFSGSTISNGYVSIAKDGYKAIGIVGFYINAGSVVFPYGMDFSTSSNQAWLNMRTHNNAQLTGEVQFSLTILYRKL